MFNGTNPSGKEFDVLDEDGDVLGSFDHHGDAVQCARTAPWWAGEIRMRRDIVAMERRAALDKRLRIEAREAFDAMTMGL